MSHTGVGHQARIDSSDCHSGTRLLVSPRIMELWRERPVLPDHAGLRHYPRPYGSALGGRHGRMVGLIQVAEYGEVGEFVLASRVLTFCLPTDALPAACVHAKIPNQTARMTN